MELSVIEKMNAFNTAKEKYKFKLGGRTEDQLVVA